MRIIIICLSLLIALPAFAQDEGGTISATSSTGQDAAIATRIRDILDALGHSDDITVMVDDGVVTLRGTANSAPEINQTAGVAGRVEGVVAVRNEVTETTEIGRRLDPAVERFRTRMEQLIAFIPLALIGAIIFAGIVIIGFAIARMRQPWNRIAPNAFIAELYRQLVRLMFVVGALVIALDVMNATALLSTILGAAGIIGLALGFAVRDTVENFIASIMLSIRQPFRPNDTVEINGDQGRVIRLTSRATILLSFDGNHIRIPNATVFKSRIVNFSQNAERRFKFSILVDRETDLQAARALMEQTVQDLPFVLDTPVASVWIELMGPAGAEMTVTGWVKQNETSTVLAKGEAIRQVKRSLMAADIAMPDATQTIIVKRENTVQPIQTETATVTPVTTEADRALTRIVEAERSETNSQDLLREDAEKE
ncbi:MAG: small conductance mechanosensitive channel [Gammaproteobacteria bacterium]|jgi:small conductance mechanosensitive channel